MSGRFGVLVSLVLAVARPAAATNTMVTVKGSHFSPAALTIELGDTVVWENTDASDFPHTTTSDLALLDPNYWNGLLASQSDTFDHPFNTVGTFTYHDELDPMITGTISVVAPTVTEIRLESAGVQGGQFLFVATGLNVGKTNVLEASTNLTSWVTIQTAVAANTTLTFTNAATLPRRFFRLFQQP